MGDTQHYTKPHKHHIVSISFVTYLFWGVECIAFYWRQVSLWLARTGQEFGMQMLLCGFVESRLIQTTNSISACVDFPLHVIHKLTVV